MKVLIAGASGFIGRSLAEHLRASGAAVSTLRRSSSADAAARGPVWDPQQGRLDPCDVDGFDAVVHLGGVSLSRPFWTRRFKRELVRSRVQSTELLAKTLSTVPTPPKVFLVASAVGFYGTKVVAPPADETTPAGTGFLASLCQQWEAAAQPAVAAGIRTVHLRFGIVLGQNGGVLPLLTRTVRYGLGALIGDGRQHVSWISAGDAARALAFLIEETSVSGPVNVVAPNPVTLETFLGAIEAAVKRKVRFRIPARVAALVGGDAVRETVLADQVVVPRVLLDRGFRFDSPVIQEALRVIAVKL